MKSLQIDTRPDWRGGQNQVLLTLCGLGARGHETELLALEGSALASRAQSNGFAVHAIPQSRVRLGAARIIQSLVASGQFEIVHAHDPHGLTAAWLARAHRHAILVTHRRTVHPLSRGHIALARYRAADKIFAISKLVARIVIECGIDASRVEVNYDGVVVPAPVTADQRSRARRRWSIAEDEKLLGYMAYMVPGKDHDTLLHAFRLILDRNPQCRLLLVGDGPLRSELEKLARDLNITEAVIFGGFVENVPEVFQALDVFLFPALNEGLGSSLLSAMAYRLPCIAAASGAVPEVIDSEHNGLLVPSSNAEAVSNGVLRLLTEREWAFRLGAAARETVIEKFSADKMVEKLIASYSGLRRTWR